MGLKGEGTVKCEGLKMTSRNFAPSPSAPHHGSKLSRMSLFLGVGGILTSACLRPGPQGLGRVNGETTHQDPLLLVTPGGSF